MALRYNGIDRIREGYRRHQAKAPSNEPTPERQTKAAGIGHKVVGRREVRKLLTTADILERHGHLPKHLRTALDAYTAIVADAMAVAVHDNQHSTARLISGAYNGMPPGEYGSREPPQRALDAAGRVTALERAIPEEMRPVLHQLVHEETGLHQGRPPSLAGFGNQYGWNAEKQAVAAGGMLAVCACMELHHQLMHGIGKVKKGGGAPNLRYTQIEGSIKKR